MCIHVISGVVSCTSNVFLRRRISFTKSRFPLHSVLHDMRVYVFGSTEIVEDSLAQDHRRGLALRALDCLPSKTIMEAEP